MIAALLAIFSSGGFGSIIGLVGGILNRQVDIKAKALEYEHDLKKMAAEQELIKVEYEQRTKIATIEAETAAAVAKATVDAASATAASVINASANTALGAIEVAGYEAMGKSYDYARTTAADGWVDRASKAVRPLITVALLVFTFYVFYKINVLVETAAIQPSATEVLKLWTTCIEWILFQAGVCVGWWFAMRPGKQMKTK